MMSLFGKLFGGDHQARHAAGPTRPSYLTPVGRGRTPGRGSIGQFGPGARANLSARRDPGFLVVPPRGGFKGGFFK
jgi:hypothetical protein